MKSTCLLFAICSACLALAVSGCRRKAAGGSSTEVESAASKFVAAEPAPATTPAPGTAPAPASAQEMQQAVQAYKGGQFEDAVIRLQRLRAAPAMTPQQRMALNDAMAAVMADIYALAAQGDQRAVQAVKQYEKLQTQRR